MRTIVISGSDRKGRDTEECHSMEDVKAFLERPHIGDIHVYLDGCWEKHHLVPRGLGVRIAHSWDEFMEMGL